MDLGPALVAELLAIGTVVGFLAGMLDFLMAHEPTLMAFCAATGTKPETVMAAAQRYSQPTLGSGEI